MIPSIEFVTPRFALSILMEIEIDDHMGCVITEADMNAISAYHTYFIGETFINDGMACSDNIHNNSSNCICRSCLCKNSMNTCFFLDLSAYTVKVMMIFGSNSRFVKLTVEESFHKDVAFPVKKRAFKKTVRFGVRQRNSTLNIRQARKVTKKSCLFVILEYLQICVQGWFYDIFMMRLSRVSAFYVPWYENECLKRASGHIITLTKISFR